MTPSEEYLRKAAAQRGKTAKIGAIPADGTRGENASMADLLVQKGLFKQDELSALLESFAAEERRKGNIQAAESALFGKRVSDKGLATASEIWRAIRDQEHAAGQGMIKSLDWHLAKAGILDSAATLEILGELGRRLFKCRDCDRREYVEGSRSGTMRTCPGCGGAMGAVAGPADLECVREAEKDPMVGREIAGCLIESLLGKGGMGAVYKARHLSLNKYVAVKILTSGDMNDSARQRFLREARTAARLEHANIVLVFNTGSQDGYHYIVMQYVDGCSVADLLRKQGPLAVAEAVRIGIEAARGIHAAHNLGMIHRDIKPDNIMVDRQGNVKVADFGLAKDLSAGTALTITGQAMGTPAFISPEQARDAGTADARSDIYSFGATMYAFLTSAGPFSGSSPWDVISKHLSIEPADIREKNPEVPDTLWAAIKKSMSKKPEARQQDMGEVIEDLLEVQRSLRAGSIAPAPTKKPAPEHDFTLDLPVAEARKRSEATGPTLIVVRSRIWMAAAAAAVLAIAVVAVIIAAPMVLKDNGASAPDPAPDNASNPGGAGGSESGGAIGISIHSPAKDAFLPSADVAVTGKCTGGGDIEVLVNNRPAATSGDGFRLDVRLEEGSSDISIEARDRKNPGRKASLKIPVVVDTAAPVLSVRSPAVEGVIYCNANQLAVRVEMKDANPDRVTVNDLAAAKSGEFFEALIPFNQDGTYKVSIRGFDKAGNPSKAQFEVVRDATAPTLSFRDLPSRIESSSMTFEVKFDSSETLKSLKLGGYALTPRKDNSYSIAVKLTEGVNRITITAEDLAGNPAELKGVVEAVKAGPQKDSQEDAAWVELNKPYPNPFDQIAAMNSYLGRFPKGKYAASAAGKIAQARRSGLPPRIFRTDRAGIFLNEIDGMEMVLVPGGVYTLGTDSGTPAEGPAHEVELTAFLICVTEVTNRTYAKYLKETAGKRVAGGDSWSFAAGEEDFPATGACWEDAAAYCEWAGGTLPTEAQWEAAARGSSAERYPWGGAAATAELCNCMGLGPGKAVKAGSKTGKSPSGCLDMAGNAWEWCRDYFSEEEYKRRGSLGKDPCNTSKAFSRVLRGGGFNSLPETCTVTWRLGLDPSTRKPWLGFRVAIPAAK